MGPDTLIIFLFMLLIFGARHLPRLGDGLQQAVREFLKAGDDFRDEITPLLDPLAIAGVIAFLILLVVAFAIR